MKFTVYIDESGDSGISNIRNGNQAGASPYFALGAVVLQPSSHASAQEKVADIKKSLGKKAWKHATQLDHAQKVYFAREISTIKMRLFGLISRKETLGEYKSQIENDHQKYYNK